MCGIGLASSILVVVLILQRDARCMLHLQLVLQYKVHQTNDSHHEFSSICVAFVSLQ